LIKDIIFDFDGVICESLDVKAEAFYELYLPYGKDIALKVKQFHLQNGGMSRFDKFEYFESNFLNKNINRNIIIELAKKFSNIVKEKVIKAPLVEGIEDFLKNDSKKYNCFIVSATPIEELQVIVEKKDLSKYFKEILGTPKNKIELVDYLIKRYNINTNHTLFIGDAKTDFLTAKEHKINFILRETKDNYNIFDNDMFKIKNLVDLDRIINNYF